MKRRNAQVGREELEQRVRTGVVARTEGVAAVLLDAVDPGGAEGLEQRVGGSADAPADFRVRVGDREGR